MGTHNNFSLILSSAFGGILLFCFIIIVTDPSGFLLELRSFNAEVIATWGSGFIGALIGGVVTWLTSERASIQAELREKALRYDAEKASVLDVIIKGKQILDIIGTYRSHLFDILNKANKEHGLMSLNIYVEDYVSSERAPPHFNSVDFVPFVIRLRAEIMAECMSLSLVCRLHENCFKRIIELKKKRDELIKDHVTEFSPNGDLKLDIPKSKMPLFEVLSAQIEMLLSEERKSLNADLRAATKLLIKLNEFGKEHFSYGGFIDVAPLEDN